MSLERRTYRVLVLDNSRIVCFGLTLLFAEESNLSISWNGRSYQEALHHIRSGHPDLVIVGLKIEGISIFDLIKDIRTANARVHILVYGSCKGTEYSKRLFGLGVHAYVRKSEPVEAILTAVRSVLSGKTYNSPSVKKVQKPKILKGKCVPLDKQLSTLTNRELEIYRLIGTGKASHEIAKEMGVSGKTVETYRSKIRHKLSLRNNIELIQTAFYWVQENIHY